MVALLVEACGYRSRLHARSRLGLCAIRASHALHFYLSHSSFQVERDAHVNPGLQSMSAAAAFVVVCNCTRLGGRRSGVGARSHQHVWAEAIVPRTHGVWTVAAFEVLSVAVGAVGYISAAVIEHRRWQVVGQATMVGLEVGLCVSG